MTLKTALHNLITSIHADLDHYNNELLLRTVCQHIPSKHLLRVVFKQFASLLTLVEESPSKEQWIFEWFAEAQKFNKSAYDALEFGPLYEKRADDMIDSVVRNITDIHQALSYFFNGEEEHCQQTYSNGILVSIAIRSSFFWQSRDPKSWEVFQKTEFMVVEESEFEVVRNFKRSDARREYEQSLWLALYFDLEDIAAVIKKT